MAPRRVIPFNTPVYLGTELQEMARALEQNGHVAGGGPFGKACEAKLSSLLGAPALLVTSATHALEMAALLVDLKPGDEVIVPSFTFVSTANAFVLRGAVPVFCDVGRDGNLLVEQVEQLIGPRTRAIAPVHYGGSSCDMDALMKVAGNIPVIEDAAQAIGATFDGKALGTFGVASALSFHETKNIGSGEGGALVLADERLVDRAHILRDKGTNRQRFTQGLVDKYTWVDVGSSFTLSDLNAAYLHTQLEALPKIQARRRELHDRYRRELSAHVSRIGAYLVEHNPRTTPNHHVFAIVFAKPEQRDRYIAFMREQKIITPFHYVALHLSPKGRELGAPRVPLTGSEKLSSCLVRLPLFYNLSDADQGIVIDKTVECLRAF